MLAFACEFVNTIDSDQVLPNKFLPDYAVESSQMPDHQNESTKSEANKSKKGALEEDNRPELVECEEPAAESDVLIGTVRALAEDYYNTNLLLHSFI